MYDVPADDIHVVRQKITTVGLRNPVLRRFKGRPFLSGTPASTVNVYDKAHQFPYHGAALNVPARSA